jgi:excisionase family DNA binding protein
MNQPNTNTSALDVDAICGGLPEFIGCPELARALGVSTRHVERMAAQGTIPAVRIGKSYRIPTRPAFEAMASAATAGAKGEPEAVTCDE